MGDYLPNYDTNRRNIAYSSQNARIPLSNLPRNLRSLDSREIKYDAKSLLGRIYYEFQEIKHDEEIEYDNRRYDWMPRRVP